MELSPKVAAQTSPSGRRKGRHPGGAFSGMNRTTTNVLDVSPSRLAPKQKQQGKVPSKKDGPQKERETFHALKMHKALSTVSYGQRSAIKSQLEKLESFASFPLLPVIQQSIGSQVLPGMADLSPTPAQSLAIPALLGIESRASRRRNLSEAKKMQQYLLAAETGSGKTLAYVLPIVDAIKRAELAEINDNKQDEQHKYPDSGLRDIDPASDTPHDTTGRPRAIILLPTSELVTQVGSVVKLLSHTVKFRSSLISSAYSAKVIRNRLFSPSGIDVLVSTPHLLASISESEPNILSRVTHLVIDEADSLLDRSFAPSTSTIIDKSNPSLKQLILCSATIPRSLDSYLRRRFPDIRRLVTPNLHAIPRRVQLSVVDIDKQPYVGNRMLACADTIWQIGKAANESSVEGTSGRKTTRLLVFVNERETTTDLADYLNSKGIDASALHRDAPDQRQSETLTQFTSIDKDEVTAGTKENSAIASSDSRMQNSARHQVSQAKRHLANAQVLVSTDLGSRGIDTLAVRHVLLYDVPHTTVDFIHRLGRTGRMGRRGRGVVLVGKHDRKDVVREVREGMYKGQALI